ncbi:chemotaxis protein CheA [Rheinheimera sp.]|uniref:chemotaxis protein CheA n=1 Tax=Rheinheimera sp. TaxID=1869214 RepID=UPI00307F23D0
MDMEQAKQLFIDEARELLESMEQCLLDVESGAADVGEHIDAVFRAAHTIKGSAGIFGFDDIVAFTHNVETVLDKVRDQKLELSPQLLSLMLDCQSHMGHLVEAVAEPGAEVDKHTGALLLQQLLAVLQPATQPSPPQAEVGTESLPGLWQLKIRYGQDVFKDGMDPSSQLVYLQKLGQLSAVQLSAQFPPAADFDPENCYLQLDMQLQSTASKQDIEDVFEFIQDSSEVLIQAPAELKQKLQQLPMVDQPLGEVLLEAGAVTAKELEKALQTQQQEIRQDKSTVAVGQMLVQQGVLDPALLDVALHKQKSTEHKRPADLQFLKVEARKLDQLINLIGELVTAGAANQLLVQQRDDEKLSESFGVMTSLIEQIRDGTLGLRMVQIGDSFSRLKRIVRDVSKELGKEIQLEILGAETELDKSMVEKLSDPLMHIVRNALDHGIEAKELRLYQGKPAQGLLRLNAYHEAGAVVLEIQDDGQGLNAEKLRQKAIEKGLISAEQTLTEEECFKLIFAPGFSTASQVTNLSGRGVGMDVVKRNLEELRGQIFIESQLGKGTLFRIRLPLTLAIIDGFEVSVADTHFVVPLNMVQECIEFSADCQAEQAERRDYFNLRGEVLPFVRINDLFRLSSGNATERENILVVQYGHQRAGLVVDALHGELQAVIKPLHAVVKSARGLSGTTILGSGEVGFILDVPQLIDFAIQQESCVAHS